MIPSRVYTVGSRRVVVRFDYQVSVKRDTLGRRRRGSTQYGELLSISVGELIDGTYRWKTYPKEVTPLCAVGLYLET